MLLFGERYANIKPPNLMINYFWNKLDLFVSTLAAFAQPKLAKREAQLHPRLLYEH